MPNRTITIVKKTFKIIGKMAGCMDHWMVRVTSGWTKGLIGGKLKDGWLCDWLDGWPDIWQERCVTC